MINLSASVTWLACPPKAPILGRLDGKGVGRSSLAQILLIEDSTLPVLREENAVGSYIAAIVPKKHLDRYDWTSIGIPVAMIPDEVEHLEHDDVLRIEHHSNRLRVLYKRSFRHNSLLITERCNNYCVMCSQPPRDVDDSWILQELTRVIPLISKDTTALGITGGEPTVLGEDLLKLVKQIKNELPQTSLHILSNGRRFADPHFAAKFGALLHPDLMFGIPLYADNYIDHDFTVQANGGFEEALLGIIHLKRAGVKVEIRCVIHRETFKRLPHLAQFIARNLTFVDHVALMGYEAMGFGKTNAKQLFILPEEFLHQLNESIRILRAAGLTTSVYNLPLCLLEGESAELAVRSISDWKNEYLEECSNCSKRYACTGFFTSTKELYRGHVRPQSIV